MSHESNVDALTPASSQEHSQMRHSGDSSAQHDHKQGKKGGNDENEFDSSSRAVPSPTSSNPKPASASPGYPGNQRRNEAAKMVKPTNDGSLSHGGISPYNGSPSHKGGGAVPSKDDNPLQYSHPSTASAAYHNANHARMYPTDYTRSQQMHMAYQPEHAYRTPSSHYNPPMMDMSRASNASSEHYQPHGNGEQRLGSTLKRPSSELYSSYQPRRKQRNASPLLHQGTAYANHDHHQRNTAVPYGRSPALPVQPTSETSPDDVSAGAQWPQALASYPPYGYDHHLSSHHMPDHRQSPSWYNTGVSPNMFAPPMPRNDHANYTRGGRTMYPQNGQVAQTAHHTDQDIVPTQRAARNQQVSHPNFTQPPQQVICLALEEDESWLSEFLCFVRKYCTEVIPASHDDVTTRMNSKKVVLGQVGVRCVFCAHLPHKDRAGRSSTFPSSLSRIYQSLTMMIRDHFVKCTAMPSQLKERYMDLRANSSQGIDGSKQYWVDSAKKLGLVDTDNGIAFKDRRNSAARVPHWNGH